MSTPLDQQEASQPGAGALDQLVELASQRLERGESIDIDALCAAHPQHAAELRELLPAVAMLLGLGAATVDARGQGASALATHARLGDFRLIREIGRGGMGVVYEAEQVSLHRRVALKVLPFGSVLDKHQLARFTNEARAAATLDHPNIVAVHAVGSDRGVHYFAMQLIEGQSLAEAIANAGGQLPGETPRNGPADERSHGASAAQHATRNPKSEMQVGSAGSRRYHQSVAEVGIQAARALEHAHTSGVLHRDIKPANLLLDRDGKLWITDFGLARICTEAGLTMSGDLLGTLRYMSPEQLSSGNGVVDHRSDIYSLGATLYELLALRPAFEGDDRPELMRRIASQEPRRLRQIDRRIPVDLETIVAKAMEKAPSSRYATAGALADDLQRFVAHQPIQARPATTLDRLAKWSRRHHAWVAAAGLALILLSAVLVLSMAMINRARVEAVAALSETADLLYLADMNLAYEAWDKGWSDEAHRILQRQRPTGDQADRRGFEWHLLNAAVRPPESIELRGHAGSVNEIAIFPDRSRLASVGDDGTLRIWDAQTLKRLQTIRIGDKPLHSVAISPDGRLVATGSTAISLCDLHDGARVTEIFSNTHNIESLAFDADGKRLAVGPRYDDVLLMTTKGEVIARAPGGSRNASLELVPQGAGWLVPARNPLLMSAEREFIRMWDRELSSSAGDYSKALSGLVIARISSDGKLIFAIDRDSQTVIFDRSTGKVLATSRSARAPLRDMAISSDASRFAVAYTSGAVDVYDAVLWKGHEVRISRPLASFTADDGETFNLKFVTNGTLATAGADGQIKLWNLESKAAKSRLLNYAIVNTQFSPDNTRLAVSQTDGCYLLEMDSGKIVGGHKVATLFPSTTSWSPQGTRIAVCVDSTKEQPIRLLDGSAQLLQKLDHPGLVNAVAFSADDRVLASIGARSLRLHNAIDGKEIATYDLPSEGRCVAFSHDGPRFAFGMEANDTVVKSLHKADHELRLDGSRNCTSLAFSPDDLLLATGHGDGTVRIWDLTTRQPRRALAGHESGVRDIAFTSDGRTLLTAAHDGTVRVWSVAHGREFGVFFRYKSIATGFPKQSPCRLSLSHDDATLVVADRDIESRKELHIWSVSKGSRGASAAR